MIHIKLSHSRVFLVRAYLLQNYEMLFDAHWHAFRVVGSVPGPGISDHMRTALDGIVRGKKRQINMCFLAMASHYVFEPDFCNRALGWTMGQVEKNLQDARPPRFSIILPTAATSWKPETTAFASRMWQQPGKGSRPPMS